MIGQLLRVASAAGTYAGEADYNVGQTATSMPVRKATNGYIDGRVHPSMNVENQLDAFRGTVYAATDKIARRIAQVPVRLIQCEHDLKEDKLLETRINFHPFMTMFSDMNGHRPHEEYSVWEMMYTLQVSLDTTGEGWWLIERDTMGRPSRITPLPSNRMTIVFNKETGLIAGYFYCPKMTTIEQGGLFFPKNSWPDLQLPKNLTLPFITFYRYPSPRGIEDPRGWSPIKAASYAYDINLFEAIYKRNFLQQGAQLGGILQSEVALSKDQIEEYLEVFKIRHSGMQKAGLPMVLPKMLKWTTTEPTPRDMQWAEAMNLTQSQILQIYGISDAKLGRADIGNRNTADAMDVTFNREVIKSRLDTITSKLNTEFLPVYPGQTDKLYFTVRYDDPVPNDGEAQMKREDQDLKNGVVTVNELRKDRNMQPFGKYGDQIYKQLNVLPVDPHDTDSLEISQDDADKMGFISPEDAAKIAADADAAAAKKSDGEVDGQASNKGKKDAKKGQKSFGRSLREPDPALIQIVSLLQSDVANLAWKSNISGIVMNAMDEEVDAARLVVGGDWSEGDLQVWPEWAPQMDYHIKSINDVTAFEMRETVEEGLANDETRDQIVERIEEWFSFCKRSRALTIARTEILGATNFASYRVYARAGVPYKRWISTMDDQGRDTHAELHKTLVTMGDRFAVGDSMMEFPGDPTASAREVICCRCMIVPEYATDRSIYDDPTMSRIWEAFNARSRNAEILLADAARLVFEKQRAQVRSTLNLFSK